MKTGSQCHDPSPLCCCEYVDINGERKHILMCCCNCTELDSSVDRIICCREKRSAQLHNVCGMFQDRMRIPWFGGAKHINIFHLAPVLFTIILFVIAAQGWVPMSVSFLVLISSLTFPVERCFCFKLETPFYTKVFFSCMTIIVFVYEYYVVPQLEITFSENMVFVVFMILSVLTYCKTNIERGSMTAGQITDVPTWSKQCQICNKAVHGTDFHSTWLGCCIGIHNQKWYMFSLTALLIAVFDCSYLTLTTVCRPYELVDNLILVPQDCDEVFVQWQYSICFVSGAFSLLFSGVLLITLVRELIFVSIGITVSEWRCLPLYQKLYLGLISHRPHSKGFFLNWYQVFRKSYI